MALPTTREQLKEYCLRALGKPVISINVDDQQLEDRIDDALQYYRDYHFDGSFKTYLKHQVTAADKANGYIDVPEYIFGVNRILPVGAATNTNNIFNFRYQLSLNDLYDLSNSSVLHYAMAMEYISLMEQLFTGNQPIRFNRHMDKLYIDMDWASIAENEYLIVECYRYMDPETYSDVYSDRWLIKYTTQLFKKQWGENISKFRGIQLPGGIELNGELIYSEAKEELQKMEEEMINSFSLPVMDILG